MIQRTKFPNGQVLAGGVLVVLGSVETKLYKHISMLYQGSATHFQLYTHTLLVVEMILGA
jgi:hypothetical protein